MRKNGAAPVQSRRTEGSKFGVWPCAPGFRRPLSERSAWWQSARKELASGTIRQDV